MKHIGSFLNHNTDINHGMTNHLKTFCGLLLHEESLKKVERGTDTAVITCAKCRKAMIARQLISPEDMTKSEAAKEDEMEPRPDPNADPNIKYLLQEAPDDEVLGEPFEVYDSLEEVRQLLLNCAEQGMQDPKIFILDLRKLPKVISEVRREVKFTIVP